MSEHTKEPWIIGCMDDTMIVADHVAIAVHRHKDGTRRKDAAANAARIVACVNACAGITTDTLVQYGDGNLEAMYKLEAELAALRNSLRKQTDYAIALQRLIEFHCSGIYIPKEIYEECPHHANLIEKLKARQLTDGECEEVAAISHAVQVSFTREGQLEKRREAIRQWFAEVTR